MKNINFAKNIQVKDVVLEHSHIEKNRTILDNYTNDYYTNNFHFRDTVNWESGKPSDIIALGCSHTYGIGVPQDYNWPSIIKLKTNKSLANLGICGGRFGLPYLLLYSTYVTELTERSSNFNSLRIVFNSVLKLMRFGRIDMLLPSLVSSEITDLSTNLNKESIYSSENTFVTFVTDTLLNPY